MMRTTLAAIALAASAVCMGAPASAQGEPETRTIEGIVAIVNDEAISYSDVRERASLLLLTLGVQQPNQEQIQQITSRALDELIDEKLQLQEATEYEVEVTEDDISGAVSDMASQSGLDRDGLVRVLREAGVDPQSLEAQMRAEIAWRRIMGGLYGSRIRVSQNQIDERLAQLEASARETQYQLSEIFLYTANEEEKQQALQGAETILEQLRAGAPFEVAAQRFSSAPTAAAGGDMGLVGLDDVEPAVADAVRNMSEPGLTEPIAVDDGVYIVQFGGKRDPADTVSVIDLVRLSVENGSEEDLLAAKAAAQGCEGARELAANDPNLLASDLGEVRLNDLGPEGQAMVDGVEVGQSTDILATSSTLAIMFVCDRSEQGSTLPSREQIEDQLFSRQLAMISQRQLRDLRRDATIIQRGS